MALRDHRKRFRPVRAGIEIGNLVVDTPGTIGFMAVDNLGGLWIVSCFHVLHGNDPQNIVAGRPVYQPFEESPENLIAYTDDVHVSADLDCSAARLTDQVNCTGEILNIGRIEADPIAPKRNMRVIKSGRTTGITEGRITRIDGAGIEIKAPKDFPGDYEPGRKGDSGSLWIDIESRRPVAMLTGGTAAGEPVSHAVSIIELLDELDLRIFID